MKLDLKTMIIAGAVASAMVLEAVVMLMMMPSQPKPAAGDASAVAVDAVDSKHEGSGSAYIEERIDEFKCTNNREESNLHLRFKVDAVILKSKEIEFRDAVKARKARIRHAVEKIIRGADRVALNDPSLNSLNRQIREEINKVLEKDYMTDAVIHDFSMIEQ